MGLGMALSITVLGALREILGQVTLLKGLKAYLVKVPNSLHYIFITLTQLFTLFILPPGAFIGLGILLAIKTELI